MGFWQRHKAFAIAALAGICGGGVAAAFQAGWQERVILGADAFFLCYLITALVLSRGLSPEGLRERAEGADEGLPLILILAVFIIGLSLGAIFLTLNRAEGASPLLLAAALASVPLGWATLHLLAAHHYARLYYARRPGGRDAAGIGFPGDTEPGPWDFTYFAFVVGMTAQVSDATVTRTPLRQVVLLHSVVAFFYNTVILTLAVNAALVLSGKG